MMSGKKSDLQRAINDLVEAKRELIESVRNHYKNKRLGIFLNRILTWRWRNDIQGR